MDVVIHSYRHRFGLVAGDPSLAPIERQLAGQPVITVPSITLDGDADGVLALGGTARHASRFAGPHEHRIVPGGGHNLPQEMPEAFAAAILDIRIGRVAERHAWPWLSILQWQLGSAEVMRPVRASGKTHDLVASAV